MSREGLCLVLIAGLVAGVAAQQPQFRSGLTTVAVPVTVIDRYGYIVKGLEQDAFTLYDEGKVQPITNFTTDDAPLNAVVLIDTSASMTAGLELARYAAEQFVLRLWPGDRAKIGTFNEILTLSERFSRDRDELLRYIRGGQHVGNPTRVLDAVDNAISTLVPEQGRKMILLLTDGCDTASRKTWAPVRDRLREESIMLYTVEVPSTVKIRPDYAKKRSWTCEELERQYLKAETIADIIRFNDWRRNQKPALVLNTMTQDTGGSRIHLRAGDDANSMFTQLLEEIHHLYLLGFVPKILDGEYHRLKVTVKDKSMLVRARGMYHAAPPDRPNGGDTGRQ
ncbi:MAG TPA: VWA domain-containing protein [Vicinamibacterales bacterium]|nr:VWA domain-containing protein [Vicinamibacterales bacterium]